MVVVLMSWYFADIVRLNMQEAGSHEMADRTGAERVGIYESISPARYPKS